MQLFTCSISQDYIQKILLSLSMRIESTHRPFEKRRLFLAYCLFVHLICKELRDSQEGIQAFVVMDTIHTVVRILTKPEGKEREEVLKELFAPCCDLLLTICQATVEACPKVCVRLFWYHKTHCFISIVVHKYINPVFASLLSSFSLVGVDEAPTYYCCYTDPICTAAIN